MFIYLFMKSGSVVVLHVHRKTICQQFVILDNRSHRKRKKTSVYLFVKNLKILHHAHSSLSLTNRLHLNLFWNHLLFCHMGIQYLILIKKRQLQSIYHKKVYYKYISRVKSMKNKMIILLPKLKNEVYLKCVSLIKYF